ncbi:MAG: hypothetical protein VYE42_08130, partial [Actinomycetota bacterium]|nr:hypothetical protein [Actinomycetota bacterium]
MQSSVLLDELPTGTWVTLSINTVALRLEGAMTGIKTNSKYGQISFDTFDETKSPDATRSFSTVGMSDTEVSVRFTRLCEFVEFFDSAMCERHCALIIAASQQGVFYKDSLSMLQTPIASACPYDVHIWVPKSMRKSDECLGFKHIDVANGDAGAATSQICGRARSSEESLAYSPSPPLASPKPPPPLPKPPPPNPNPPPQNTFPTSTTVAVSPS